jgi:hypothetical protein
MVAVCLLFQASWDANIKKIVFLDHPRQKKIPFQQKKSWTWWHTPAFHPSDHEKPKTGQSWSQLAWAKSKTLSPKQPKGKGLGAWLKW